MDDYFIITGGRYLSGTTVSKYDKRGWEMDLTSLNTGRRLHSCGHYYSDTKELVICTGCTKKTLLMDLCDFLTLEMLPIALMLIKRKICHLFLP